MKIKFTRDTVIGTANGPLAVKKDKTYNVDDLAMSYPKRIINSHLCVIVAEESKNIEIEDKKQSSTTTKKKTTVKGTTKKPKSTAGK